MYPSSPRIVSQPDFVSSPSDPRLLGQILPDLILRLGLRCIDFQLANGQVDEARRIFKTLNNAVSFERAA